MLFTALWIIVGALILTLAFVWIALIVSEARNEDGADCGAEEGATGINHPTD